MFYNIIKLKNVIVLTYLDIVSGSLSLTEVYRDISPDRGRTSTSPGHSIQGHYTSTPYCRSRSTE